MPGMMGSQDCSGLVLENVVLRLNGLPLFGLDCHI